MIHVMAESTDNIIGFRTTGKLKAADYHDVLHPRIDKSLKQFPRVKALFFMDETFAGWSLSAAWENTVFDLKHRRDFGKIAIVGGPKWEGWCVKAAAAPLMGGEMRTFRRDDLTQAWQWLRT